MTEGESPSPGQRLFALPPLARAALALALVGAVAAVALAVGASRATPARFRAQVGAVCAGASRELTAVPSRAVGIERRSAEYAALAQRLSALRAPTIESPFYHAFVGELLLGELTWRELAAAARGGRDAQLRALERAGPSRLAAPFAYAKAKDLGCTLR
jgi:hypothetical protein